MELHNDKTYQCDHCPNSYESKDRLYVHKKRPTQQGLLSTMRRTLQMAGQMTQTHEEMHTLRQVQGYEKGLGIQKTVHERAK